MHLSRSRDVNTMWSMLPIMTTSPSDPDCSRNQWRHDCRPSCCSLFQVVRHVLRVERRIYAEINPRDLTVRIDEEGVALGEFDETEVAQRAVTACDLAFAVGEQSERQVVLARERRVAHAVVDAHAAHIRV